MKFKTEQKTVSETVTEIPIGTTFQKAFSIDNNEYYHVLNDKTVIKISYNSEDKNNFTAYDLQGEYFKLSAHDVPIKIVSNSTFLAAIEEVQNRIEAMKIAMLTAPISEQ